MMEVCAGFLEQTDYNVGRVLKTIEELGQLDNTMVIYSAGDNGASAEGSLQGLLNEMTFLNGVKEDLQELLKRADDIGTWKTFNHYPVGWANAMCTPPVDQADRQPLRRHPQRHDWPSAAAGDYGAERAAHPVLGTTIVIDIAPTLLDGRAAATGPP
jgi:arylsulfatase